MRNTLFNLLIGSFFCGLGFMLGFDYCVKLHETANNPKKETKLDFNIHNRITSDSIEIQRLKTIIEWHEIKDSIIKKQRKEMEERRKDK